VRTEKPVKEDKETSPCKWYLQVRTWIICRWWSREFAKHSKDELSTCKIKEKGVRIKLNLSLLNNYWIRFSRHVNLNPFWDLNRIVSTLDKENRSHQEKNKEID